MASIFARPTAVCGTQTQESGYRIGLMVKNNKYVAA